MCQLPASAGPAADVHVCQQMQLHLQSIGNMLANFASHIPVEATKVRLRSFVGYQDLSSIHDIAPHAPFCGGSGITVPQFCKGNWQ